MRGTWSQLQAVLLYTAPCWCGNTPVIRDPREGVQMGEAQAEA